MGSLCFQMDCTLHLRFSATCYKNTFSPHNVTFSAESDSDFSAITIKPLVSQPDQETRVEVEKYRLATVLSQQQQQNNNTQRKQCFNAFEQQQIQVRFKTKITLPSPKLNFMLQCRETTNILLNRLHFNGHK